MVIKMELKHVILRGGIYCFRMRVPKNCVEAIGKTEIIISLRTNAPLEARTSAARLEAFWTKQFKQAKGTKLTVPAKLSATAPAGDDGDFRQGLIDQMEKNLPVIFEKETEKQLHTRFTQYAGLIDQIKNNYHGGLNIPELGIKWPLKPSSSPRQDRQRVRDLIEVLNMVRAAVANEMVNPPGKQESPQNKVKAKPDGSIKAAKPCPEEHDILEVAELML